MSYKEARKIMEKAEQEGVVLQTTKDFVEFAKKVKG